MLKKYVVFFVVFCYILIQFLLKFRHITFARTKTNEHQYLLYYTKIKTPYTHTFTCVNALVSEQLCVYVFMNVDRCMYVHVL